ncbi:MAG: amidohydrolase [Proteobacteria bacterium]|nr:amidohydrolase [Pseudomonadota bacterium]
MMQDDMSFSNWLIDLRRHFHIEPEISSQEKRTTEKICSVLREIGVQHSCFNESFGALGLIKGGHDGPTIGLRADIDALPIQELNNVPYRSKNKNVMHACGHDAHTAIMLGVAKKLAQNEIRRTLRGNVKFIFQPAEERINGAREVIRQGALDHPNVDRVVAGHMDPTLDTGIVGVFKDYGYAAADGFSLVIKGKGGHGGRPHETIDPIVSGAHFVTAIQGIVARNINPIEPAVISIGKFHSGNAGNVIPEIACIEGTVRTHSNEIREQILIRLQEIVHGLQTQYRVECTFDSVFETPACNCDREISQFMFQSAANVLGKDNIKWIPPTMGSEDFAFYAIERPSAIIRLGCRNTSKNIVAPLHSPYFDIDETVLEKGVNIFCQAVISYLS